MSPPSFDMVWKPPIVPPAGGQLPPIVPDWLEGARRLRARVFYDGGRRPRFRDNDGDYTDPDPADFLSFHLLACHGRDLAACARFLPLRSAHPGLCESLMGGPGLEGLLRGLGLCRERVVEGGRWAVAPEYRRQGLGERFVVAGCEAVRNLGLLAVLCAAGTEDGQSDYLGRFGFEPVPGHEPVRVEDLSDTVLIMKRDLVGAASSLGRQAGLGVAVVVPSRS